jgi:hypothetical protein
VNVAEIRKQISVFLPLTDWRAIRDEAIRRDIPMTELCRQWMRPHVQRLINETPRNGARAAGG